MHDSLIEIRKKEERRDRNRYCQEVVAEEQVIDRETEKDRGSA